MAYSKRDYETYRERYDRGDEGAWSRREAGDFRNEFRDNVGNRENREDYSDASRRYTGGYDRDDNRDFDQGYYRDGRVNRSSTSPDTGYYGNYEGQASGRSGMGYPDRYSAGQSYADESYYRRGNQQRQGAQRSHLRCRDLMSRNVTTCNKNTRIQEIARLMREEDIGAIPVLDERGKLEGIVTDRDIIVKGLTSNTADAELDAEACMSTDLFTANQNDRLVDVLRDMGDHQVRRVPVVDNRDRLVGIISMADVATHTNKDRELEETLTDISKPSSFFGRLAYYLGL